jgi:CHAT domain-containing protein
LAELDIFHGNTTAAAAYLSEPPSRFPSLTPRYEMLRGYSLSRVANRYPESQELLKRSISDAITLTDTETLADSWLWFGVSQMNHGDLNAADQDFNRAGEVAGENRLDYQAAEALNNRGLIKIKLEHYAAAIPLLESARTLADKAGARLISSLALNNLADCYENVGNVDQALAMQKTSVAELEQLGLETFLSIGYSDLGNIYLSRNETTEAVACFRRALAFVNQDAPVQYANAAGNLASALEQTGKSDEAERFNQSAFRFADPKDEDTVAWLTSNQAAIAQHRGQSDQAILAYQKAIEIGKATPSVLWQAHAGLAAVYAAKGDFALANKNYAETLTVITSNRADQLMTDYKITFLSNLIHFYQDYVALLMQHGDTQRALEIADSSRASVLAEGLLGQSEASRTALLPQIQKAAKASHSAFLFYWLAPKSSYLWAITGTQCKAVTLADQKQIAQDVLSYRSLIEEQKSDPLATVSPAGVRLYRELIAPVADLLTNGARVVVVPDGVLHNLNFETLIVSTPQPHYWIEDATISVAPSLSIVRAGKPVAPTHRSLLIMGDPLTAGTEYPPLPEAALEIAKIQRQFPAKDSTVLTGTKAVVEAYAASQPQKFSTIHFATHVDANSQSPLDSAIILSPQANRFSLYARDVARTPLNADLVTISACRSAGDRALSGEGLVGFAWAFFQARAQNVVTSLWDVYDNSTAQLMEDFYSGVTAGHPYASALRDAKRKMFRSTYKRPYYWAPFQLYSRTP